MAYTKKNAPTKRPLGEGRKDQFDLDTPNNTMHRRNRTGQPSLQDHRHGAPANHAGRRFPSRPENGCQSAASPSDRRAASMPNRDVAKAAHLLTRVPGELPAATDPRRMPGSPRRLLGAARRVLRLGTPQARRPHRTGHARADRGTGSSDGIRGRGMPPAGPADQGGGLRR